MASRTLYLLLCCLIASSSAQSVTVQFEMTSYSISENAGQLNFQVDAMFMGGAPDIVTVTISGFPAPHVPSMDFNITMNGTQSLSYPIIDDNLLGEDQMFEVTLSSSEPVVIGSPSIATVNITEDDMVTIGFDETMYTVFEGDDVTVCVSLQNGQLATNRDVVVTLTTDDTSGSGEMLMSVDFDSLSMDLTFSNATTTWCVNISTKFNVSMNPMPFNVNLTTSEAPTAVSLSPAFTTVTIQNVIAPGISTHPMSIDGALPNSTVTFDVSATGQPLNYQWYMVVNGADDTPIDGAVEATLTLTNVTVEDEGMYYCIITNRAGSVTSNTASLTVLRTPTVMLTMIPTGVLLNEELMLSCMSAVNATITLMVVDPTGTELTLNNMEITADSKTVTFSAARPGEHNVTCTANNSGLTDTTMGQFYAITIAVADVTAGITATAVFFCNVTGATVANGVTYRWYQTQNGVFPVDIFPFVIYEDRVVGRDKATLSISNLSGLEQNYNYTCNVSISGMEIGSAMGSLTSPGPVVLDGPESQVLRAGERLSLICTGENNIDATMPLRINWLFTSFDTRRSQRIDTVNDSVVTEMRLDDNITVISNLTINSVMPNNGGIYGCQVSNRDGALLVEANATVTVLFTPQIDFMVSPQPVSVGMNPQLTCTITAEPLANSSEIVRIMPDGQKQVLTSSDNPMDSREFTLQAAVGTVEFPQDDGALFQCRATNANGERVQNLTITVQAPPAAINHTNGDVIAQLNSLDSVDITWSAPSSNNAPITSYTLTFCAIFSANDTDSCSTSVNVTLEVGGDDNLVDLGENRLRYTYPELMTEKMYEVVVRARNSIGQQMSPVFGNGLRFNSSFPDDGRVVNVSFIPTTRMIIVTWNLPLLALATTDLNVSFVLTYYNDGDPANTTSKTVEYNSMPDEIGFSANLGIASSPSHTFQIVAWYMNPNLLSSQAILTGVRTLANDGTLLTGPQAVVNNSVDSNDVLRILWPTPNNTNFLVAYRVFYATSPVRSRRQAPSTREVPVGTTDVTLPFTAFMNYTVNVDAIYAPPPDGNNVSISLLPQTVFTTPERASSPPRNIRAVNETVLKIRLTWEAPMTPNGIISAYRIEVTSRNDNFGLRVEGATTLTYLSKVLNPNTAYTFKVAALNGFAGDGQFSTPMTYWTNFSVVQPVITNTIVGNSESPLFTINTNTFSDDLGEVGVYKVVVVRSNRVNPSDIPDAQLLPAGVSQFNYYVAYYGNAVQQKRSTFTIGDNSVTTDPSGTMFTNPPPVVGENYYVFIRLYSNIDPTVFVDSELAGVLVIARPLDPAVIIAPIAVIAVLLLIILVVLLVVVFLFTRPRRGYTIAATGEDGVHRKKRGGGIELRRTRLFSPVVNVPVPDVFTSAGQPTTLVCEASGTPAPEVVWTQNNEPLDKERFIHLADSSLFVNDTDLKDEGAYIVTATNSAGTAEQMVRVTVIRPSPPEPDPEHPPIKVGEFTEKIALLRANDDEGLEDEYSEVEPDITFTSYAAKININKNKNRYINIIPYDHSRVVLSLQDNTPGSDYINASYIDGFNRPNAYIATQGPQPSTFPDFWRMIWEFDSPTIVMVTNLKEEDKLKCHQYWPNYGTTTYGSIQVTLKGVENLAEYSIRTFHITPIAGQSRVQMPVREVKQFHFLVWPDHGVPQFATPLLSFRKRVAKYHPDKKGPMVVHCSAGVGRTGTFVTIDTMLRQMEAEGVIDIFNFVRHMRFRRNYMVQTAPQYVFIHDALLEAIMCGDNSIPAPELRKRFQDLMEVDPESKKSRLQLQFENLNSNSPQDDDFDSTIANLPDNMAKNRFKVHLPANDFRVPLGAPPSRSEGGDDDDDEDEKEKEKEEPDYICASFADGYRQRNAFIITQAPMNNTTGDFWKMIWEQKSAAIVMLTELEEDGKEMSVKYWPGEVGEASLFGSFQLELSEDEKDKGDYVTRKFKLSHVDAPQDCRIVTQFHFTKWPRSSTPKNPHSVIDLIDEIQRVQRKSGNQPITIHCDDGVSRTGAFCTLYSVLERVKVDQVVDVYLATKTLRIQRAGLLETLDQYIFVHKAVIEFLDSFSDYQNFK